MRHETRISTLKHASHSRANTVFDQWKIKISHEEPQKWLEDAQEFNMDIYSNYTYRAAQNRELQTANCGSSGYQQGLSQYVPVTVWGASHWP